MEIFKWNGETPCIVWIDSFSTSGQLTRNTEKNLEISSAVYSKPMLAEPMLEKIFTGFLKAKEMGIPICHFFSDQALFSPDSAWFPLIEASVHIAFDGSTLDLLHKLEEANLPFSLFYFWSSEHPYTDSSLVEALLSLHSSSLVDICLSKNYPTGFVSFSAHKDWLAYATEEGKDIFHSSYHPRALLDFAESRLNLFDIDILFSPQDFRFMKDPWTLENPALESLFSNYSPMQSWDEISRMLHQGQIEGMRSFPKLIRLELFSTAQTNRQQMKLPVLEEEKWDMQTWEAILSEIHTHFPLARVEIDTSSVESEDILPYLEKRKQYPSLQCIWKIHGFQNQAFSWKEIPLEDTIVFHWNAIDEASYSRWVDSFPLQKDLAYAEAMKNMQMMLLSRKETVFLEFSYTPEEEELLEKFLKYWAHMQNRILMKSHPFLPSQTQEGFSSIRPMHRFPCWKLERELHISASGWIHSCAEGVGSKALVGGKYPEASLQEAWRNLHREYQMHWQQFPDNKKDPVISESCQKCLAWFQFSF